MGDKHVVLTGATAGLGKASAEFLAYRGAELTLVVRNRKKGQALVKDLKARTGNSRIRLEIADLSLMADVDKVVSNLNKRGTPVDVLINNAGALFNPRQETSEGLEQSFALLLLGPYRLTEGLYPLLKQAAEAHGGARVINVVSGGMYTQKLRVGDLQNAEGNYSGSVAYARCKRALMVKTEQWAEDWADEGIVVNAMHPGWADTPGVESALPEFHKLTRLVLRSPEEGADTINWLAVASEAGRVSGKLFLDREPRTTHLTASTRESAEAREQLRDILANWDTSSRQETDKAA
jgi:NAD(P)-dependent dehydrogenase (short-subunit alcohol dehydrogenase family)